MAEVPITGMTERAFFCMLPENEGGCDETENLIPIHFKRIDPDTEQLVEDKILGWLCMTHASTLALRSMGPSAN